MTLRLGVLPNNFKSVLSRQRPFFFFDDLGRLLGARLFPRENFKCGHRKVRAHLRGAQGSRNSTDDRGRLAALPFAAEEWAVGESLV